MKITIELNGEVKALDVRSGLLLIELLRRDMRLTGTHQSCETAHCGACTVLIDGMAAKSCTVLAVGCDGSRITTVEGLANGNQLHPMQASFQRHHGLQCGFCTPGMILIGIDIVRRLGPAPNEQQVRRNLEGNLCRCTGYESIVKAIVSSAEATAARDTEGSAP